MTSTQDLIDDVRSVTRDTEGSFVSDADILTWLNEAYLDLCARLRLLRTETTGLTTSAGKIAVPADYMETVWLSVLKLSTDVAQSKVEFVDDEVFDSYRLSGSAGTSASPGTAAWPWTVIARIFGGSIETFPVIATLAYTFRYVKAPTPLDVVSEDPVTPPELDIRLVNYARGHAKYKEGEIPEGDRYMQLFTTGLPAAARAMLRERPGPTGIVPEPSYFDSLGVGSA